MTNFKVIIIKLACLFAHKNGLNNGNNLSNISPGGKVGIYLKAGLGDFVQILPLIYSLSQSYKIVFFTTRDIRDLLSSVKPDLQIETYIVKHDNFLNKLGHLYLEFLFFRSNYFELMYFPPIGISYSMTLAFLASKSGLKIAYDSSCFHKGLDITLKDDNSTNNIEKNNRLLDILGLSKLFHDFDLAFSEKTLITARNVLEANNFQPGNYIVVFPHSKNKFFHLQRLIDLKSFSQFLQNLFSLNGIPLIFVGSPNDKEYIKAICDNLIDSKFMIIINHTLLQKLAIIRTGIGIIGIDGGIMHLAQLLHIKKVTIWNQSDCGIYGYIDGFNMNIRYQLDGSFLYQNISYSNKDIAALVDLHFLSIKPRSSNVLSD